VRFLLFSRRTALLEGNAMKCQRFKNVPLIAALARAGISGQQLAHKCKLHPITISQAINCRVDPKPETIRKIAAALQASPEELGFTTGGAA